MPDTAQDNYQANTFLHLYLYNHKVEKAIEAIKPKRQVCTRGAFVCHMSMV
jgi:hypothetical protein